MLSMICLIFWIHSLLSDVSSVFVYLFISMFVLEDIMMSIWVNVPELTKGLCTVVLQRDGKRRPEAIQIHGTRAQRMRRP